MITLKKKKTRRTRPTAPRTFQLGPKLTFLDVVSDACARGERFTISLNSGGQAFTVLVDRGGPFNAVGAGLAGGPALVAAASALDGTCTVALGWSHEQPLYHLGLDVTLHELLTGTRAASPGLPPARGVDALRNEEIHAQQRDMAASQHPALPGLPPIMAMAPLAPMPPLAPTVPVAPAASSAPNELSPGAMVSLMSVDAMTSIPAMPPMAAALPPAPRPVPVAQATVAPLAALPTIRVPEGFSPPTVFDPGSMPQQPVTPAPRSYYQPGPRPESAARTRGEDQLLQSLAPVQPSAPVHQGPVPRLATQGLLWLVHVDDATGVTLPEAREMVRGAVQEWVNDGVMHFKRRLHRNVGRRVEGVRGEWGKAGQEADKLRRKLGTRTPAAGAGGQSSR